MADSLQLAGHRRENIRGMNEVHKNRLGRRLFG
ncbi:hypothetical protein HNQ49_003652 [Parapusillimonas granuli]|nr:hypothetical protein [Parapusillimonas granuli]